jgi:uncharacterized SAM-binding protein YcdF (DUF218 family)
MAEDMSSEARPIKDHGQGRGLLCVRRSRLTTRRIGVGCGLISLLGAVVLFTQAGTWLVVKDPFGHAPVAVVMSGLPISRSFAARDLYTQGRVDRLLIIPEPPNKIEGEVVPDRLTHELTRWGLFDPTLPQWAVRILTAAGVPETAISVLPRSVNGTINEAQAVRSWFGDQVPKQFVVITSPSASRRARVIFREIFRDDEVQIVLSPTPHDGFLPERWWTSPRTALTVVTEYQKLLANALTLLAMRFHPVPPPG